MALKDRIAKLEGEQLCEECPAAPGPIRTVEITRIAYPDGTADYQRDPQDRADEPTPQLCERCPYGPGGKKQPIRTIEIVRTVQAAELGEDDY